MQGLTKLGITGKRVLWEGGKDDSEEMEFGRETQNGLGWTTK